MTSSGSIHFTIFFKAIVNYGSQLHDVNTRPPITIQRRNPGIEIMGICGGASGCRAGIGNRRRAVDGGRWMMDGGKWMVDGRRQTVDGGWWMGDGGRWMVDGE